MLSASTYRTPGVHIEWLDANPQRVEVRRTDVAGFLGIAERGPLHTAIKIESARQFLTTFGDPIGQAYLAYAVEGFFSNGGRTCWVVRVADPDRVAPARVRIAHSGCAPFVLEAASPGCWGNGILVEAIWGRDRIVQLTARDKDRPPQPIALDSETGQPSTRSDSGGRTLLGIPESELPEASANVHVILGQDDPSLPIVLLDPATRAGTLADGADGMASLRPEHFVGGPNARGQWGITALERVDGISFVAAPDLVFRADPSAPTVDFGGFPPAAIADAQIEILASCIRRRDRMAILDTPLGRQDAAIEHRGRLTGTSFGALYFPWVLVDDPLRMRGTVRLIPPSGHVAGMFARTDRLRGVHKPPANEVLEKVWDLAEAIDGPAHGELNDRSINAIRAVPARGVLVLGARTLHPSPAFRYVNVRRLFAMIEEALEEQMQWLVFEPNNTRLWSEIDRSVRGFLERLHGAGMLDGATPEQAFSVRCDGSTNPPDATGAGQVTCEIGIQPPYPAEFVVVRIGITRDGIQFEDEGAQNV